VSYRYQWISSQAVIDDVTGTSNIVSIEIPGETGQTYTLIPDDEGSTFQVDHPGAGDLHRRRR
jgi:hypothetical protein